MIDTLKNTSAYDRRSIRDNLVLVAWIFVWMASLVVSDKAALYGWWDAPWITIVSIGLNAGLGLLVVHRYRRLLQGMDDLQRKIQLEALAIALGISLVGACSYMLLVTWGYIIDEEISDLFVLMCVSYAAASMYGVWKYR
ncbi:MAG: hypothetical protein HKO64_12255 [Xanthomonadales bacterium]|nr:hypothetical protein [Gammaproteobacteria bacterium]NNL96386.1 hypothetical protein [Xanthomonadales bacterium]